MSSDNDDNKESPDSGTNSEQGHVISVQMADVVLDDEEEEEEEEDTCVNESPALLRANQRDDDIAGVFHQSQEDGAIPNGPQWWKFRFAILLITTSILAIGVVVGVRLIQDAVRDTEPETIPAANRTRMDELLLLSPRSLVFFDGGGQDCVCSKDWDNAAQWGKLMDGESNGVFLMLMAAHLYIWTQSWGLLGLVMLLRNALLELGLIFIGTWGPRMRHHTDAPPRYAVTLRDTMFIVMGGVLAHYMSHVLRVAPVVASPVSADSGLLGGKPSITNRYSIHRALWAAYQILIAWMCLDAADGTMGQDRINYANILAIGGYVIALVLFYLMNKRFWPELWHGHVCVWHITWAILATTCGAWTIFPVWKGSLNVYAAWSMCIAVICIIHLFLGLDIWECATLLFVTDIDVNRHATHEDNGDIIHLDSVIRTYHGLCHRKGHMMPYVNKEEIMEEIERQRRIRVVKYMPATRRGEARHGRTYRTDLRRTACKFAFGMAVFIMAIGGPSVARMWKDGFYPTDGAFMYSAGWCGNPITYTSGGTVYSGASGISDACSDL